MNMKEHILSALREEFDQWQEILRGMSAEQITEPLEPSGWRTIDIMIHLWGWQQRTLARMEAAAADREPEFRNWPTWLESDEEDTTDKINAWIYETYRDQTWEQVYDNWRTVFEQVLLTSQRIPERDMLNSERYAWLNGLPLAAYLLGTYDHHQEHLELLTAWLREHQTA